MRDPLRGLCPPQIFLRKICTPRGILTSLKGGGHV